MFGHLNVIYKCGGQQWPEPQIYVNEITIITFSFLIKNWFLNSHGKLNYKNNCHNFAANESQKKIRIFEITLLKFTVATNVCDQYCLLGVQFATKIYILCQSLTLR